MTERQPTPPPPIRGWVREFGGIEPEGENPLDAGLRALREAMAIPPDQRRAAWALLAADALLTWAVEDATASADPGTALETVLHAAQLPGDPAPPGRLPRRKDP
jgi:hypothetical protein